MTEEQVSNLIGEVLELFDAGRVGLYEFRWNSRGRDAIPDEDSISVARGALDALIALGAAKLVWSRWDDPDFEAAAKPSDVTEDAWSDPGDEPYLAVVSMQSRHDRVALMARLGGSADS